MIISYSLHYLFLHLPINLIDLFSPSLILSAIDMSFTSAKSYPFRHDIRREIFISNLSASRYTITIYTFHCSLGNSPKLGHDVSIIYSNRRYGGGLLYSASLGGELYEVMI